MIKKFLFLLLVTNFANSQNSLNLFANTGTAKPDDIVFDNENNAYFIDNTTWNVVKISNAMTQTDLVTSYLSTPVSQLNYNTFDNCLYLGIRKTGNGRIDKITKQGTVTQIVDPSNISPVNGVVCDANGNVYFSRNNGNIYKYSSNGDFSTVATGVYGSDLALDNEGNIITYSFSNEGIFKVNTNTGVTTLIQSVFFMVQSIVVHPNGDIYYSDGSGNKVYVILNNTSNSSTYISGTTGGIFGLFIKDNVLYVSERDSSKIHKTVNVLGNDDLTMVNFSLFPNPTNDVLTITSDSPIEKIEVYNVNGQFMFAKNNDFENIVLKELKNGMYLLKINDSNKLHKFIKN